VNAFAPHADLDLTSTEPLLSFESVEAGYGPFHALFGVSFSMGPGTVTALLGANGAGKTTVARVCSGLVHPTAGRVLFGSEDISKKKPFEVARLGVAHAPEGRSVFASLTVEENLALSFRNTLGHDGARAAIGQAYELFPRLGERSGQVAGLLSGGEQRMLSLARVLASPPKLLVVDELSLGLAPIIIDEVYANLAKVSAQGTALLVIEQHVDHALALADQVLVLQQGHVGYAGPTLTTAELTPYLLPGGAT
jgi:branched-chain amino acid transport system ATP-binding protein